MNIISQLNHPSIMKFIGFNSLNFKYKRKPTIITEYVSNGSLDKVIELERVGFGITDWNDTKKLINIFGIAKGMSHLHSLNILHRDLKPGNILLNDYSFPKISDFGLSKPMLKENSQNNSGYKGTWAYTAPEVFEGKYSKAGDVYAFSLIVYEIMTNEIIFKDMNQFQVMIQFRYPIYECYRKLIADCWNEKPDKRPSFDEIVHRLKNDSSFLTENIDENEFLNNISLLEDDELPNKSFHSVSFDNEIDKYSKNKFFINCESFLHTTQFF